MPRLVYSVIASVDGYVADAAGDFTALAPDEEVYGFVNDLERPVGTYLYGRRLYQVMAVWQDMPGLAQEPPVVRDYAAIWRAADKVVYSTTLGSVATARTRLERSFDPQRVRAMVDRLDADVSIGGPTLASHALRAGIVDEVHLFLVPLLLGGGSSCWPDDVRLDMRLVGQDRFAAGTVHLHYRAR